ncbi:MAG: tRNA (guanosine(46)-N7)-methyltransferase TrmB [Pseudomonadota bacterium]
MMAKNKLHKYERVKHLPNVIFSEYGASRSQASYPWYKSQYDGMQKVLELGCGKGEHSIAFAGANPGKLFVGVDSKSHRMCVGAEQAIEQGLENVFFLRTQVERMEDFFVPTSIHQIWLTFPDPHLKHRSAKSRLSAASFLDAYAKLLVPAGVVCLKTDSDPLYHYTCESVEQWGGRVVVQCENIHGAEDNPLYACGVVSAFEKVAQEKRATIKFLAFQLTAMGRPGILPWPAHNKT